MHYPQHFVDELKARASVTRVVGQRVRLRKAGRTQIGLCCFHQEKTPSLTVDEQRGRWYCYGCGEGGDAIEFIRRSRGLTFPEAVESLAADFGIPLPKPDPKEEARQKARHTLLEVLAKAQEFFVAARKASDVASVYLQRRKVSRKTVEQFGIGWAPDGGGTLGRHLRDSGAPGDVVEAAGLRVDGRDRFRGRIMFPIHDLRGRIVSFAGRDLSGESPAKYLNGPETECFQKGTVLWNGHIARQALQSVKECVVNEGYFGVLGSVQAGFLASVGTMGTATTEAHLLQLWSMTDSPIICFDGDNAGRKAQVKAIETALPLVTAERTLRFAQMPQGLDPDEMVASKGAEAYRATVRGALGLGDALWREAIKTADLSSTEGRAKLESGLLKQLALIQDASLRRKYEWDVKGRVRALSTRPVVVRANGHSNHSMSPGSIRLLHSPEPEVGLSIREAVLLASLVAAPESFDIERVPKVSERTQHVLSEIAALIGSVPDTELKAMLHAGPIGEAVVEALDVCHRAGIHRYG